MILVLEVFLFSYIAAFPDLRNNNVIITKDNDSDVVRSTKISIKPDFHTVCSGCKFESI